MLCKILLIYLIAIAMLSIPGWIKSHIITRYCKKKEKIEWKKIEEYLYQPHYLSSVHSEADTNKIFDIEEWFAENYDYFSTCIDSMQENFLIPENRLPNREYWENVSQKLIIDFGFSTVRSVDNGIILSVN